MCRRRQRYLRLRQHAAADFGGSLDCLPLNLFDQFGNDDIIVPLNTLWTLVVAAAPVGPLPVPGPDFPISTPFTLTIITPQGHVYLGSGIAAATLSWNTDSGEWETNSITYVVQEPAGPLPPAPPPPPPSPTPKKHPRR